MNYQLLVNNEFLDLSEDFNIAINKSIADVREPENRNSDWTKTFILPGTQTNKKIFGHLYHLNYSISATTQFAPDFNPSIRAAAELWVDTLPQIKGYLRLISINVTDYNEIEFECSMHGMVADLFSTIGETPLADLDFSEYNHPLSYATASGSWDTNIVIDGVTEPFQLGRGYVYGFIDEGQYSNYADVVVQSFKPMLYAKTVVDKIFSTAGFSYTTDSFFNTDTFKRLVVPCPTGAPKILGKEFQGNVTTTQAITLGNAITYDTETDPANQLTTISGVLSTTGFGGVIYNLYADLNLTVTGLANNARHRITIGIYRNGTLVDGRDMFFYTGGGGSFTGDLSANWQNFQIYNSFGYTLVIDGIFAAPTTGGFTAVTPASFQINTGTWYNTVINTYGNGSEVDFTNFFDGDFKQADFMKSLIAMFNLYVEPDPDDPTKLYIESYKDFYDGATRDWSNKLDYSQKLEIIPMGELNANPYKFSYQEGDDTNNENYKKKYNRVYGDLTAKIDNDFIRNEKKIEVMFAPTLCNTFEDRTFAKADKWGKMRILYYAGLKSCSSYIIRDDISSSTTNTETEYPVILHVDDPVSPTIDIMFGSPVEVGLPGNVTYTNNNLYNAYWSQYIEEISSPNSKIVTGYFDITPADMEKLTFRDTYFFENSYYKLNLIEDYTPEKLTKCEFIQISEAAAFVPSSGEVEFAFSAERTVLRIGELPIDGFRNGATNIGIGFVGIGNFAIASSSAQVIGDNTVLLGCSDYTATGSNEVHLNNSKVNLFNPSSGDVATYEGGEWIPQTKRKKVYVKITTDYTVADGVEKVIADANNNLVTLPDPTTVDGHEITVVSSAGLTTTIDAAEYNGGTPIETIIGEGATTFFSDYTDWHIISRA